MKVKFIKEVEDKIGFCEDLQCGLYHYEEHYEIDGFKFRFIDTYEDDWDSSSSYSDVELCDDVDIDEFNDYLMNAIWDGGNELTHLLAPNAQKLNDEEIEDMDAWEEDSGYEYNELFSSIFNDEMDILYDTIRECINELRDLVSSNIKVD